ncbi:MAG: alanine racemase [Tenericutes bacterium]|nr:alanine racemase [Mycoplasmatota bacterium]
MDKSYRETYAEINLSNIKYNVNSIIKKYNDYEYYFGVVKADCYGHFGLDTVKTIIDAGVNYLAVALLEEALEIRKSFKDIPILCLGHIDSTYASICKENNITMTVSSSLYAKEICNIKGLKVHIKVDTGMHRLGVSTSLEFSLICDILKSNVNIEGVYSHIYNSKSIKDTNNQFKKFESIINCNYLNNIKIVHINSSTSLVKYKKLSITNGCRLGIIMYGFTEDKSLKLKSTFSLKSKIVQINILDKGDTLGYDGLYKVTSKTIVGVVSIGYADGIIRKNTGRSVYINNKEYEIIGNICMDMLFIKLGSNVNINDEVIILKDVNHIKKVSRYLNTIPYEVLCSVSKRVKRIYIY